MCSLLESLAKCFLLLTNLIVCILSVLILCLSIWILVDSPSFLQLLSQIDVSIPIYTSGAILLLVAAILCFFVTCFGCCGAVKENRCMLGTYSVTVLILLAVTITGIVLAFTTDLKALKTPLYESIGVYDPYSNNEVDVALVKSWDQVQQDYKCCGVDDWQDWQKYNPNYGVYDPKPYDNKLQPAKQQSDEKKGNIQKIPESCCDPKVDQFQCTATPTSSNGNFHNGCFTKLTDEISKHAGVIGGVAIALLLIMAINFCISMYMCTCGRRVSDDGKSPRRRMYGKASTG